MNLRAIIDVLGRVVYVNEERISMTPKEYDLLFYLVKNKNLALSRDKLLEDVWGYDFLVMIERLIPI